MPLPLVLILGPTGSGKSALALEIAARFDGEIVNCDSLQLYRGFDIGTAKPSPEERRAVPHHLFDVLDPDQECTAGDYSRMARRIVAEISARGRLPIVAGGTGFYVRALLEGLFPGPPRDEALRADLASREQRHSGFLHRALRRLDPATAARIHGNDRNKLIRALEVCIASRQPMSRLFKQGRDALTGYQTYKIALDPPRAGLYHKLERRCHGMLEAGLIQEIALLLLSGVPPNAKPFEAIGYKEILSFLTGQSDLATALDLMKRDTRRYAKRQLTWFRREPGCTWVSGFGIDSGVSRSVMNMLVNYTHNLERCAGEL
jgi:tRNA dimethylallyltransferase